MSLSGPPTGAREVRVSAVSAPDGPGNCLERAEGIRAGEPERWQVVLGLVEDDGRFWPHAWLLEQTTGRHLDPSLNQPERRRYLAFPTDQAGQLYLELLDQSRQLLTRER